MLNFNNEQFNVVDLQECCGMFANITQPSKTYKQEK